MYAAGISINADLLGSEADPYQRRSAKNVIGQRVGESCVVVIYNVEINGNYRWLCCEATAEQIVRLIIVMAATRSASSHSAPLRPGQPRIAGVLLA